MYKNVGAPKSTHFQRNETGNSKYLLNGINEMMSIFLQKNYFHATFYKL